MPRYQSEIEYYLDQEKRLANLHQRVHAEMIIAQELGDEDAAEMLQSACLHLGSSIEAAARRVRERQSKAA